jgi:hypothetical protein
LASRLLWPVAIISNRSHSIYIETGCAHSWSSSESLHLWFWVATIVFTFKRPIRAEVDTYRIDLVLGSLHMKQLYAFDD